MATRVNLPSELRIKGSPSPNIDDFEASDVVYDTTGHQLKIKLNNTSTEWRTMVQTVLETTIAQDAIDNVADYEAGQAIVTQTGEVWVKIGSEWTRFNEPNSILGTSIDSAGYQNFDASSNPVGSILIDQNTFNSYIVIDDPDNPGTNILSPLGKKAAVRLVNTEIEDVADFVRNDVVISHDLKILKKEQDDSTQWTTLIDLQKTSLNDAKFSFVGAFDDGGSTKARTIFSRSRGVSHDNVSTDDGYYKSIDDLTTYHELMSLDKDIKITWDNGRGIDAQRMAYVLGNRIFPTGEIYNRQKDSAYSLSLVAWRTVNVKYFYINNDDPNNPNRKVQTYNSDTLFSYAQHIHPESSDPDTAVGGVVFIQRKPSGNWAEITSSEYEPTVYPSPDYNSATDTYTWDSALTTTGEYWIELDAPLGSQTISGTDSVISSVEGELTAVYLDEPTQKYIPSTYTIPVLRRKGESWDKTLSDVIQDEDGLLHEDGANTWKVVDPTKFVVGDIYNNPADQNPSSSNQLLLVVDKTSPVLPDYVKESDGTTDYVYSNSGVGLTTVVDTSLVSLEQPLNCITRLDEDSGVASLNSFTVGYRQKARIWTVRGDEVDQWGANTAFGDGDSQYDRTALKFLVSVESI